MLVSGILEEDTQVVLTFLRSSLLTTHLFLLSSVSSCRANPFIGLSDFDTSLGKTFNNNSVHYTCSRSDYN